MKLYFSPGACSMAPHILLNELGKKFEIEKVDLREKKTASGKDYRKINAKGYVPAIEMKKGEVLTEVGTILQYLADKAKATKLLPKAGTKARYHAMEMLNFVSSELHKGYSPLFNPGVPAEGKDALRQRVALRLTWLNDLLAKQKFVSGKSFGVADAYAFTVLNWSPGLGVDLTPFANIQRFMADMAKRPSVKKTLAAEAAAK
ncbi:glutathione transferase GstA [Aestuariivirga litoralis]|uniref:glutathione transferase GstA n=1 Tax=Aestuariivirga litoralis TaxID=2650924 RepID=UPI0018C6A3D9|nr:glutathione transferase GstA [Aestuariivirga litoralis]MBG1231697.1 glutathione transferase GstA [Aestuariivirga litoralis]